MASFCVIAADAVRPREFTTYFRSVIAFGRIGVVDSDAERLHAARLLGEKYNPGDEEGLTDELEKGLRRMAVLRLDLEHLSGKEAIEIVRSRQQGWGTGSKGAPRFCAWSQSRGAASYMAECVNDWQSMSVNI